MPVRFNPESEIRVLAIVGPEPDPRLLRECHIVLPQGSAEVRPAEKPSGQVKSPSYLAVMTAILDSLDPLI